MQSSVATMSDSTLVQLLKRLLAKESLKSIVFYYYVYYLASKSMRHVMARGVITTILEIYASLAQACFRLMLKTPMAKRKVSEQIGAAKNDLRAKFVSSGEDGVVKYRTLPDEGLSKDNILQFIKQLKSSESEDWKSGRVSGALYHPANEDRNQPTELAQTISAAIDTFMLSNPLHPELFAPIRKFEAELISMVLSCFNADLSAGKGCGTTTRFDKIEEVITCST